MTEERDIGAEILNGIRELKLGKSGRVVNVPPVAEIREKTGLSQARFAALLGVLPGDASRFFADGFGLLTTRVYPFVLLRASAEPPIEILRCAQNDRGRRAQNNE